MFQIKYFLINNCNGLPAEEEAEKIINAWFIANSASISEIIEFREINRDKEKDGRFGADGGLKILLVYRAKPGALLPLK